jgi:hypothetical protein
MVLLLCGLLLVVASLAGAVLDGAAPGQRAPATPCAPNRAPSAASR